MGGIPCVARLYRVSSQKIPVFLKYRFAREKRAARRPIPARDSAYELISAPNMIVNERATSEPLIRLIIPTRLTIRGEKATEGGEQGKEGTYHEFKYRLRITQFNENYKNKQIY